MADLLALVSLDTTVKRVASTDGGEYAGPCPWCGGEDRFRCWPDHPEGGGGQWWCRQCNQGGDLIAYRVARGDLTPQEAGKLRENGENGPQEARRARDPRKEREKSTVNAPVRPTEAAPAIAWQEQARIFCSYCQGQLFEGDNEALAHLHGRGLTDETIRAWGLGYHERKRWRDPGKWGLEGGNKIFLPRGVVIPWTVDGTIWHVKFRRFDDDPKYIQVRGGLPTLYGLDQLTGKQTVVICEGEFDAVLLQQEAGDLVDVVAIGAKAAKVNPKALAHLAGASDWLLALDTDAEDEAGTWAQYSGRVRRIKPLEGNDLTDFHNAGGDLRAWIEHHTAPLGDGLLAEAEALLQTGLEDPGARVRYAEIADRLGWPCSGMTWKEWGAQ